MKARFLKYWDYVRSSFWFVPLLMAAVALVLAYGLVQLDRSLSEAWFERHPWTYGGGADGATAVLETVSGSMITIAGLVFSMTLVVLSLAAQQFGPRLLRNFMNDKSNQLVLGTFVATFLYASSCCGRCVAPTRVCSFRICRSRSGWRSHWRASAC